MIPLWAIPRSSKLIALLLFGTLLSSTVETTAAAEVTVLRSVDKTEVAPGDELNALLNVSVSGNVTGLIVTEKLPSGFRLSTSDPSPSRYDEALGQAKWLFLSLTGVKGITVNYTLAVLPDVGEGIYRIEGEWNAVSQAGTSSGETEPTELRVRRIPTTLSLSVSSSKVKLGESVTVSGLLSPAPPTVTLTLTYFKPDGSTLTRSATTSANGSFADIYKAEAAGLWAVTASWSGDQHHAAAQSPRISFTAESRCLIATATYGSELSPEVQFLREFRDRSVRSTFAGSQFMDAFEAWYYSFSPSVASFLSQQSLWRDIAKVVLHPSIAALHLSSMAYSALAFNPELGVVTTAVIASLLIGALYLSPIVVLLLTLARRLGRNPPCVRLFRFSVALWAASLASVALAETVRLPVLMAASMLALTLLTAALSASGVAAAFTGYLSRRHASGCSVRLLANS